ncbi:DrmB family protein [Pseudidiomarina sp. PP-1MA]|uniref:DrmB family protein n=1 Tax=Pseudidiomarina sp. PP-1MA TaxID=3237706 RepID=A0AB39X672_9GAMM
MKQDDLYYTPVRFSHLLGYSGVGSIVRLANYRTAVICDTRFWNSAEDSSRAISYVKRISSQLAEGRELRAPPVSKVDSGRVYGATIPAVLFPKTCFCRKCGALHLNPWAKQNLDANAEKLCCRQPSCNGELQQVTWCAIGNNGYLSEVDWYSLCHTKHSSCRRRIDDDINFLKIQGVNGQESVVCTKCSQSQKLPRARLAFVNEVQPWLNPTKHQPVHKSENGKSAQYYVKEINDPITYSPVTVRGIVIPPESRRLEETSLVEQLKNRSAFLSDLIASNPRRKESRIRQEARSLGCSPHELSAAVQQVLDNEYEEPVDWESEKDPQEEEYLAFLTELDNLQEDEDFVPEHETDRFREVIDSEFPQYEYVSKLIENLVIVKRLREILIFKGFQRGNEDDPIIVPPDIEQKSSWLPATELFGEGIFFSLNNDLLSEWERQDSVRNYVDNLSRSYESSSVELPSLSSAGVTPRFVLLHTIAHLFIRELESSAGYPAASIRERIYCSRALNMAGVLIYTTSADVAGTLGGLMEQGRAKQFLANFVAMSKRAEWCSLDPVCSEASGQGIDSLNMAACHACSLVPETSCDYLNILLDRKLISGSKEHALPSLESFVFGKRREQVGAA